MRAGLQAKGPLYGRGHKTQIPPRFESALRPGPTIKTRGDAPPASAADQPAPPPARLRTPSHPGVLGLRGTRPGAPRERGRRRGGGGRPSWRPAQRAKERREGRSGGRRRRAGGRGAAAGAGGPELRFLMQSSGGAGRGARPGGGACHRSAVSPFAFSLVGSGRDQISERLRAGPGRGRRGEGGAAASRRPPCARAARPLRALPREAKVGGGGGGPRAESSGGPVASRYCSQTLLVSSAASSRRRRRAESGAGGAPCASLGLSWAGMGGGPSGDEEPEPAARPPERRL